MVFELLIFKYCIRKKSVRSSGCVFCVASCQHSLHFSWLYICGNSFVKRSHTHLLAGVQLERRKSYRLQYWNRRIQTTVIWSLWRFIHHWNLLSIFSFTGLSAHAHVELPYYSKFLLIAAYLASYNPVRTDKRFFLKVKGFFVFSYRNPIFSSNDCPSLKLSWVFFVWYIYQHVHVCKNIWYSWQVKVSNWKKK